MEILVFFGGAFISWLITHLYHRHSSKNAPEWAEPLMSRLPQHQPTESELQEIIQEYLKEISLLEKGQNSNGEWFQYISGEQICTGQFKIGNLEEIRISFPAAFVDTPSVDLSGEVSQIKAKRATSTELIIELNETRKPDSLFTYQAKGRWKEH
ncbi:hypothetical protein IG389_07885 [Idiomarina abyssalis]|jgi:hypothetical protein|uniref:Uncharacterized protein n=1 Tax=Idiomarina abyssalis TaxID=86102 RepID=A0A8I1G954_9GAMM|nr:hypothetical protein [Idiomarina abyssalis]MAL84309.1 hypothetical protein [Idiomarina sp.]MBJ7265653.1 hypothetical protein [Idiomarina abyssalis]MBJ7273837.1 hypothetical protein [Idiomarina abyssalis]MBJ7314457.1 hypothetical protein [Idiomarina abyssalis]